MRIGLYCNDCIMGGQRDFDPDRYAPFSDNGLYQFTCRNGHEVVAVVQQMRFEILAEVAVQAIVDGYYREAVTSFNASLERFMQFYVEAVFVQRQERGDLIGTTWKLVERQSERQFGMFLATYLHEMSVIPPVLPQQCSSSSGSVQFRNDVVHKGLLPTEKQAVEFGQAVVNLVQPILNIMATRYAEAISAIISIHQAQAMSAAERQHKISSLCYPMVYKRVGDDPDGQRIAPVAMNIIAEISRRREKARSRIEQAHFAPYAET